MRNYFSAFQGHSLVAFPSHLAIPFDVGERQFTRDSPTTRWAKTIGVRLLRGRDKSSSLPGRRCLAQPRTGKVIHIHGPLCECELARASRGFMNFPSFIELSRLVSPDARRRTSLPTAFPMAKKKIYSAADPTMDD